MSTPPLSSGGFMSSRTVVGEMSIMLADSGGPGNSTTYKVNYSKVKMEM